MRTTFLLFCNDCFGESHLLNPRNAVDTVEKPAVNKKLEILSKTESNS
jgi:hypothetical protein